MPRDRAPRSPETGSNLRKAHRGRTGKYSWAVSSLHLGSPTSSGRSVQMGWGLRHLEPEPWVGRGVEATIGLSEKSRRIFAMKNIEKNTS